MTRNTFAIFILGAWLVGCQSASESRSSQQPARVQDNPEYRPNGDPASPPPSASGRENAGVGTVTPGTASGKASGGSGGGKPIAIIGEQPLSLAQLHASLIEASGGQVLTELVLARAIERQLREKGLTLTPKAIAVEKELLLSTLDPEPDQAQRLLEQLRTSRGLGPQRFDSLLYRNAGLRLLVQEQVTITDVLLRRQFELEHGLRYEVRLITVETLPAAGRIVEQLRGGASFVDLAIAHSTDPSAAQGGLLSPISPADPTYPSALRSTLPSLQPQGISDPIALDHGFAILKLERKIEARPTRFDDVKEELALHARRQLERLFMQQLARTMITDTRVTILDPALSRSWEVQKKAALGE